MHKDYISKDKICGCQTSKPSCKTKKKDYCNVKPDMESMFVYPINLCDVQIYQILCPVSYTHLDVYKRQNTITSS